MKKSRISIFSLVLMVVLLLSSCNSIERLERLEQKYAKEYSDESKMLAKYLEKEYGLKTESIVIKKSTHSDYYSGTAYLENDPSMGIQVVIHEDGTIEDNVENRLTDYEMRIKLITKMNKLMPENELAGYVSFNGTDVIGPNFTSTGFSSYNWLQYVVLQESINENEQLEIDYKIYLYAKELFEEYYPDKELNAIHIAHVETADFDLEKYKKTSFEGRYASDSEDRGNFGFDIVSGESHLLDYANRGTFVEYYGKITGGDYWSKNESPRKLLEYSYRFKDVGEPASIEDFKKKAKYYTVEDNYLPK